jgi:hypothetical protein
VAHSRGSNADFHGWELVKSTHTSGVKPMRWGDEQCKALGKAILIAKRELLDRPTISEASVEGAIAHLDLAEAAFENRNFDRAYYHYAKTRGAIS